ncbi:hypothetical protein K1719_014986 [Acacia pycnantha]|nr:hypothetical protein K1719_014986 [Acacia pycnantha]
MDGKINHLRSLLRALINAYEITDGCFHIGQNRLYFGLEDVLMITGLPIDGKPVIFEDNTQYLTEDEVFELVGVLPEEKFVSATRLVEFINSFNGEDADEDRLNRIARAVALLGIACMISQDNGKSRVHMKFVNFLKDVGEISKYAWGAASWVNLHTSLKGCKSKAQTSLFGCVLGLEIFFLIHIPKLIPIFFKKVDSLREVASFPLLKPCVSVLVKSGYFDGKNRPLPGDIWKIFYELDPSEVVWQPYHDLVLDDPYFQHRELRGSHTTALFLDHAMRDDAVAADNPEMLQTTSLAFNGVPNLILNMVYYKMSHVDGRIINPECRIASDVPKFCSELSEIVQDDLTAVIDGVLYTRWLCSYASQKYVFWILASLLGVGATIRNFSPSFGKLMSREQQLEGDATRLNRLSGYADRIHELMGISRELSLVNETSSLQRVGSRNCCSEANYIEFSGVKVVTPTGNVLVDNLTPRVESGSNLLITGIHWKFLDGLLLLEPYCFIPKKSYFLSACVILKRFTVS